MSGDHLFNDANEAKTARPSLRGARRTVVWLDPEQIALAQHVAAEAELDYVAAGSAGGAGASTVADKLGAERHADLRRAVLDTRPDALLLLTLRGAETSDLETILEQAPMVVTIEPLLAGVADAGLLEPASQARLAPFLRDAAPFRLFDELRESFGAVRSVSVNVRSGPGEGLLYARLTDAIEAIEWLAGSIEQLDAGVSGPLGDPPKSLREMHGHITLNARFANNCCACAHVSDLGGRWSRGVTVIGEGGCVRMTDTHFDWWSPDGQLMDQGRFEAFGEGMAPLLAEQINRGLDPRAAPLPPRDLARLVAVCESARLSATTAQGETPRKLLEMIQG